MPRIFIENKLDAGFKSAEVRPQFHDCSAIGIFNAFSAYPSVQEHFSVPELLLGVCA
jgi:hypothetical protein